MKRFLGLPWAMVVVVAALLALFGVTRLFGDSTSSAVAAAPAAQQIGMKVLLITDSANSNAGIADGDWVNTLQREGVPYTSVVTNSSTPGSVPLPALSSTLSDGTQVANYEGVVVTVSGTLGLTTAQWDQLQTFEHQFSVRQVTAYAVPSSDYGLNTDPTGGCSTVASPGVPTCAAAVSTPTLTAAGQTVFPYLNRFSLDPGAQSTWVYQATPLPAASIPAGASVNTLISGPNGSSMLGIYTSADGRQTMYQTFNENQYYLQSQLLRHGELDWLARNTYFGDQRNYLETNIDDNFLSDDSYTPGTGIGGGSTDYNPADALRETPTDVATAAAWSAANHFRIDMLFNGGGSQQYASDNSGSDPLLTAFQADKGDFGWINHTWDHPNLDQGCANQTYIQNEITENTNWATTTLGLGTSSTSPLGNQDPGAVVTGEHAGLANLIPGNPGTVDPPEFDAVTASTPTTATTMPAGSYTYAITDDFVAGGGQSSASESTLTVTAGQQVAISWTPVCHAADYYIYRLDPGATTWTLIDQRAATAADFGNSGAVGITFTDTYVTGTPATSAPSTTVNNASESPYEQNTTLTAAFGAVGINDFGSDASKPYPNPATATFATGTLPPAEYPAGSTFPDGGATAVPRYPTNIYYNASTEAQEVNEYETIYDDPTCKAIAGLTTCYPANTAFTMSAIVASVDQNMFQHMMGNDPRPHYFHQTNLMGPSTNVASTGTPPATLPTVGDGLYYETMNPLLAQYNAYFASNAPIEQLTMAQIGTLLSEQAGWVAANASQISGYIDGSTVTVNNNGAATEIPLTGTNVGTQYAGTVSGWTLAPSGTSTYGALAAWPAQPTTPAILTPPGGPAPGSTPAKGPTPAAATSSKPSLYYVAVQVAPKKVSMQKGTATVSLKCEAKNGKAAKNHFCTGKFTLKVMGKAVTHSFRIKATKTARISVKLPKKALLAAAAASAHKRHVTWHGALVVSTKQPKGPAKLTRGTLTIKT